MNNKRKKYIELLLEKCIYSKKDSLFISYDKSNYKFIEELIVYAKERGFKNILLDETDIYYEHTLLETLSIDEIKKHKYFNKMIWNKAAEENYVFLLATSPTPNFFDDIDSKKLKIVNDIRAKEQKKYIEKVMSDSISWTIFALPNQIWADFIFPNDNNSYEKLETLIYDFCMIIEDDAIEKWNEYIKIENKKTEYLNKLNIKQLILKNSFGTNLTMELVSDYIFRSLELNRCIENIPTFSIWTTPHKYKVNGIVYGSIPITYRKWVIEDYWFKFLNGKVIDYGAKIGKEYLDNFFSKGDSYMRLGEIAIIDYDSPIAKTNRFYNCNLLDENISTHLAFGSAYQNTIKNGTNMNQKELEQVGCNICPEHMDFSIGTKDLEIIAVTFDNQTIQIFKDGNFNYDLINNRSPFIKR